MAATRQDIERWIRVGQEKGATHVIIVCDTFDYEDYPVYVMPGEDARKIANKNNGPNMTKLMEVYNLAMDVDAQLKQYRAMNF